MWDINIFNKYIRRMLVVKIKIFIFQLINVTKKCAQSMYTHLFSHKTQRGYFKAPHVIEKKKGEAYIYFHPHALNSVLCFILFIQFLSVTIATIFLRNSKIPSRYHIARFSSIIYLLFKEKILIIYLFQKYDENTLLLRDF